MFTTQTITAFDPTTGKVQTKSYVKRGDTVRTIESMASKAEAEEFLTTIRKEPDRLAPYVSKSGHVVVVFTPQDDPRNSWEPKAPKPAPSTTTAGKKSYRCAECGKVSPNRGAVAIHQKSTHHKGIEEVDAEA